MIRRLFMLLTAMLASLVLGLLIVNTLLTRTDAGARWLLERSSIDDWGGVPAESVTGNLADGLRIPRMTVRTSVAVFELESIEIELSMRWFAPQILIRQLNVGLLRIQLADSVAASDRETRGELSLVPPLPIRLESLTLNRLLVVDGQGIQQGPELAVGGSGSWDSRLDLTLNTDAAGAGWSLKAGGGVALTAPYAHEWTGSLALDHGLADRAGLAEHEFQFHTSGDAQLTRLELASASGSARADLEFLALTETPRWKADIHLDEWSLPDAPDRPGVDVSSLAAKAAGEAANYQIDVSATLHIDDLPEVESRIQGSGDLSQLDIQSLTLVSSTFDIEASGSLGRGALPELRLDARLNRLAPSEWLEAWPAEATVQGRANFFWANQNIEVSEGFIEIPQAGTRFIGSGRVSLADGDVQAQLAWQDARWPLAGPARLYSRNAEFSVHGTTDAWSMQGGLDLQAGEYPAAKLGMSASGSRTRLDLSLDPSAFLGGQLQGKAEVDWGGPLAWSAQLLADDIDPSPIWPEWPGRLAVDVALDKPSPAKPTQVDLNGLRGVLRDQPLSGQGRIMLESDTFSFNDVRLTSGASRLHLDGNLRSSLDFSVDIQKPSIFRDWLDAAVTGSGRLGFANGQPRAELDLAVSQLVWDELRVDQAVVTGTLDPDNPDAALAATASGIVLGETRFERLEGQLLGGAQSQRLGLHLQWQDQRIDIESLGNIVFPPATLAPAWSGRVEKLAWSAAQAELLRLARPAQLELSGSEALLDDFCLHLAPQGKVCAEADWKRGGALRLAAELEGVPANLLTALAGYEIEPVYELGGSISWEHGFDRRPSGGADIRLWDLNDAPGTDQGRFRFTLSEGELTEGELFLPFEDSGMALLEFSVAELALDGTGKLEGRARIDLDDISILDPLVTGVEPVSGQFDVDARLGGLVAEPHLDGIVRLEQARFDIPALELSGIGLSLSGDVNQDDRMSLRGQVESGEGVADVSAEIDVSDWNDASMELSVRGERLAMMDVPSLRILASPNLRLGWRRDGWFIDGALHIPEARISPAGSSITRIDESEDVEIVAGSLPDRPLVRSQNSARVSGQMKLSLGDQVRIEMPGIKMAGSGELDLLWKDNWTPTANGQLLLNGEIRTFGPLLVVENGPVRFANRPVDDPALDVRAERDIFGNTQIRSAGVHVRGTAKNPVIEAYTVPLTNEDRAWALLVTGSDFDYGQGIGAFDIGTYIAPRLYISYGINLFGDERTVSARYDLRKGFGVKATASAEGNGIDASFTIER